MKTNTKPTNPMKVITGKDTRWSYANVWEAKSINGGAPKFSVLLLSCYRREHSTYRCC